jgi:RNA polymerase sigma factor (sigma-70 family)
MSLTIEHIRAAQDNDLAAITAVIADMDERISRLAAQAARRLNGDHREDFEQDAREALFRALPRFDADTVDAFHGFMFSSIQDALKDKVRSARYVGVDKDAVKVFMSMLGDAEGDPYRAEQMAQTVPAKGLRLSADRAHAARLAWQGIVSVDQVAGSGGTQHGNGFAGNGTIADTLAVTDELPQVQPKVGHGAALEALAVLNRYVCVGVRRMTPGEFSANLPALVEALEDTVRVPSDPTIRRYVLDAMAVLRSAVSTASDGDLADELRDVSDDRRDERVAKIEMIRNALGRVSAQQYTILVHSFGIGGAEDFGWGDGSDLDGLAKFLGTTPGNVKKQRSAGRLAFTKHFIALAVRTLEAAMEWEAAAAEMRKPAGRK